MSVIAGLFKRLKPKLSKKDQQEFLRRKEMRECFNIEFENGFYNVYLDGDLTERFNDKGLAKSFIESVITASMAGEMDYKFK